MGLREDVRMIFTKGAGILGRGFEGVIKESWVEGPFGGLWGFWEVFRILWRTFGVGSWEVFGRSLGDLSRASPPPSHAYLVPRPKFKNMPQIAVYKKRLSDA